MKKKGQITIFITIAVIVILLSLAILFIYKFPKAQSEKSFTDVETYIKQCVNDVAERGINLMTLQGGYIYLNKEYLETEYSNISFILPERSEMELELSKYMEENLVSCADSKLFEEYGYTIESEKPKVKTEINSMTVVSSVKFPIKIVKGQTTRTVNEFTVRSGIRLAYVYEVIKSLREQNEWLDLSKAATEDVLINVIAYGEDFVIYYVRDTKSYVNTDNLRFVSVIKVKKE